MSKDIEELRTKLKSLSKKRDELHPKVGEYHEVRRKCEELYERIRRHDKRVAERELIDATGFVDCEFPEMGVAGLLGFAQFTEEARAKELCKSQSYATISRAYLYEVDWEGPGSYLLTPEYEGNNRFTATFTKAISEGSEDG